VKFILHFTVLRLWCLWN